MAAVIRLTWRFLPSAMRISSHDVGIAARKRIGGSRGQRPAGSAISRTLAGWAVKSESLMPARNLSSTASSGTPSTCAQ